MKKIKTLFLAIKRHKIRTVILGIVIATAFYFGSQFFQSKNTASRYITDTVRKGAVVVTVSGSGQISASQELQIKPKVSGEITDVFVKNGQEVGTNIVVAEIDSRDAETNVQNAERDLKSSELALEKLRKPADQLTLIQAQNALSQAQRDLKQLQNPPDALTLLQAQNALSQAKRDFELAKDNATQLAQDNTQKIENASEEGYNAVSDAFLDTPDVIRDLKDVLGVPGSEEQHIGDYKNILGSDSDYIENLLIHSSKAFQLFQKQFDFFQTVPRSADQETLSTLIHENLIMLKTVSQALESARNTLDAIVVLDYKNFNIAPVVDEMRPKIQADIPIINKHISALQKAQDTLENISLNDPFDRKKAEKAIETAQEKVQERQEALDDLINGPDQDDLAAAQEKVQEKQEALDDLINGPDQDDLAAAQEKIQERQEALLKAEQGADSLDIQSQKLLIEQRQSMLENAEEKLSDYSINPPFDGLIVKIDLKKGDQVSTATPVATLITKQKIATVSLNEVDIAKIKPGQKATLTFDAFENMKMTGTVGEIDILGTITQGVVNYTVKIILDSDHEGIKPNMSVSADIIVEAKENVLLVPSEAIKTLNDRQYVEILPKGSARSDEAQPSRSGSERNASSRNSSSLTGNRSFSGNGSEGILSSVPPERVFVETGLTNDTVTEILSGLKEGDQFVLRIIASSSKSTAAGGFSLFGSPNRTEGTGGAGAGAGAAGAGAGAAGAGAGSSGAFRPGESSGNFGGNGSSGSTSGAGTATSR